MHAHALIYLDNINIKNNWTIISVTVYLSRFKFSSHTVWPLHNVYGHPNKIIYALGLRESTHKHVIVEQEPPKLNKK